MEKYNRDKDMELEDQAFKSGRKMPFEVPEGFFAESEGEILGTLEVAGVSPVAGEASSGGRELRHRRNWLWWSGGAVAAALVAGLVLLWPGKEEAEGMDMMRVEVLYSYHPEMSDGEMMEIAELISNDIFLNME